MKRLQGISLAAFFFCLAVFIIICFTGISINSLRFSLFALHGSWSPFIEKVEHLCLVVALSFLKIR